MKARMAFRTITMFTVLIVVGSTAKVVTGGNYTADYTTLAQI